MAPNSADSLSDVLREMSQNSPPPSEEQRDGEADQPVGGEGPAATDGQPIEQTTDDEAPAEPIFDAASSESVVGVIDESTTSSQFAGLDDAADVSALAAAEFHGEADVAVEAGADSNADGQAVAAIDASATDADTGAEANRLVIEIPASAPARPGGPPRRKKDNSVKALSIPVLITVGLLLLMPAVWGTLVLAGFEAPRHDDPQAKPMAAFMLVCWPLALSLLITAGVFIRQLSAAKRLERLGL